MGRHTVLYRDGGQFGGMPQRIARRHTTDSSEAHHDDDGENIARVSERHTTATEIRVFKSFNQGFQIVSIRVSTSRSRFSQPATLANNVKAVFTCLLDQVSQYTTEGLERSRESLHDATALRERFVIGSSVSRRVAAVAASAAEAAAAAGESSFKTFMVAVQRATNNVAMVQQHFGNSITRLLLPVDGAHAACCEEMSSTMATAESAILKRLQQCIDTVIAEEKKCALLLCKILFQSIKRVWLHCYLQRALISHNSFYVIKSLGAGESHLQAKSIRISEAWIGNGSNTMIYLLGSIIYAYCLIVERK